jgi:hypothetical protein
MAAALLFIPLACLGVGLLWLVWGPKKSGEQAGQSAGTSGVVMPPLPVRERAPLPPRIEERARHKEETQLGAVELDEETIRAINELSSGVEDVVETQGKSALPDNAAGQGVDADNGTEELSDEPYEGGAQHGEEVDQHHLSDVFEPGIDDTRLDDVVWDDAWVTAAMDEDDVSPELYGDLNDIFAEPTSDDLGTADDSQHAVEHEFASQSAATPTTPQSAVVPPTVEVVSEPAARYRRRRSDKRVALAKFPYDPEVWDDPLSPGKRRRLEKRAELDRRRAEELRERTYKRVEKARQKHTELESAVREESAKAEMEQPGSAGSAVAEFNDVWSRATLLEAPEKAGIEQPRERVQRKSAKKAARTKRRAAKAQAKLARMVERHEKRQELVTKREASTAVAHLVEQDDVLGVGAEDVQQAEITDTSDVRDFSENAVGEDAPMTIEVLENLPAAEELVSGDELSEREQKRAEKRAERESRKLEKLAEREKKRALRDEASSNARSAKKGENSSEQIDFEPGLGTDANTGAWDEAAVSAAALTATGDFERTQAELTAAEPEPMVATLWEQALGTEDGLQGAAVSSWEAAAHGITEFVDPTGGVRATDAEEWVELGEDIEDTAEAGPGRGKDAIIESEDTDDEALSSYDTIIEIGTADAGGKKRRFSRRKKDEDVEDDGGVSIGEWVSEGATLVTVTSDYVDHHSYDLPEPIPDRVQVTFGSDE